jgi:ArsR family transcriptional regulator
MSILQMASTYVNIPPMATVTSCCPPVLHSALGKRDAEDLATTLKALADPVRLRVLSFIAAQPGAEACVCHVREPVGLSQPTVSHHLKVLHTAGLLEREKRGAWVYYRVVPERLEELRAALATRTPRSRAAKQA